ncbi:hypothetical protein MMC20_002265 [Loxospora ochrophaea]|nr:hypothetical protein [Loxospora ochrophaea]
MDISPPFHENSQGSQGSQTAQDPRPLSCVSCRQRKIKCNKVYPCSPCQKAGRKCVSTNRRVRAPQRTQRALESRDAELLRRIRRLESLVCKQDAANNEINNSAGASQSGLLNASPGPMSSLMDPFEEQAAARLDEQYTSFVTKKQSSGSGRLTGDFSKTLGNEFDDLRQLLEQPVGSEGDESDGSTPDPPEKKETSPQFILQGPTGIVDLEALYPSDSQRSTLFDVYFANVDPLCKIMHRPTALTLLSNPQDLFIASTRRLKFSSFEAVTFSMYYAAVTSMTSQACRTQLNEDKITLLARYKRGTEMALSEADYLNSTELVTLQALTIYIMTISSNNEMGSCWALIALAVRIARGLGLHRDGDGGAFSAFHAEVRRRLWWQILLLDMRASEDLCSEPVVSGSSFNTRMPCNLNDDDFGHASQHPLPDKKGVTDMSFSLICLEVSNMGRKINFIPPTTDHQSLTIQQKEELVKECTEQIESYYLAGCDHSDQSTWLIRMVGRLLILKLWLTVQYPLQSTSSESQSRPRGQSLKTVVSFLTIAEMIEGNDSAAGYAWFFNTYVPWHALAVALAHLCTETQGPLVDQAWFIIDKGYKKWRDRVADVKESALWRLIKSLLKRARAARQQAQTTFDTGAMAAFQSKSFLAQNPDSQTYSAAYDFPGLKQEGSSSGSNDAFMASEDFNLLDQATDPSLDLDLFEALDTTTLMSPGPPVDWNNWNELMSEFGNYSADVPVGLNGEWPMQI